MGLPYGKRTRGKDCTQERGNIPDRCDYLLSMFPNKDSETLCVVLT